MGEKIYQAKKQALEKAAILTSLAFNLKSPYIL